jgi:U3 small nucleolar RNA-associated protein 15
MTLDESKNELITCSLDHHLKSIDLKDYKVSYSHKYPAPILSVGVSQDSKTWVVGMSNGLLSIRHQPTKTLEQKDEKLRRGSQKYFMRGGLYKGEVEEIKIVASKTKKVSKHDYYLKSFQYGNALDCVLSTMSAVLVTSMMRELIHRDGLVIALGGRDEKSLVPIMKFLLKHVDHPKHASLLIDVSNRILGIYFKIYFN